MVFLDRHNTLALRLYTDDVEGKRYFAPSDTGLLHVLHSRKQALVGFLTF